MLKRLLSESCQDTCGHGGRDLLFPKTNTYPEACSPGSGGEAGGHREQWPSPCLCATGCVSGPGAIIQGRCCGLEWAVCMPPVLSAQQGWPSTGVCPGMPGLGTWLAAAGVCTTSPVTMLGAGLSLVIGGGEIPTRGGSCCCPCREMGHGRSHPSHRTQASGVFCGACSDWSPSAGVIASVLDFFMNKMECN